LELNFIKKTTNDKHRKDAENIIALMTPIVKSFSTDVGCESANLALQIYGGHGYIKDHGIEQLLRDVRITPIYEGTNGIQALDLIGRKMQMNNGEIFESFFSIIDLYLESITIKNNDLDAFVDQFRESYNDLIVAVNYLKSININKHDEINGPAVEFLELFSYVSIGFIWLKMTVIAFEKNENKNIQFLNTKVATGKFYFSKILPKTLYLKNHILSGAFNYIDYKDESFDSGFII
jgi:hypothetical protein